MCSTIGMKVTANYRIKLAEKYRVGISATMQKGRCVIVIDRKSVVFSLPSAIYNTVRET